MRSTASPMRRAIPVETSTRPSRGALHRSARRTACGISFLPRPSRRRRALGVVLDRLADRLEGAADERAAVLRRPVPAPVEARERVLEARHDEAGEELVGAEGRLAVGPVVRHEEIRPEAARLLPQPLDLARGVL